MFISKKWFFLVVVLLLVCLTSLVSCDMFDDDDDDDNITLVPPSNVLIGTWYRYSLTLDGTSNDFVNAKLVLEEGGVGNEYTYEITESDLYNEIYAVDYDITWSTDGSELSILDSENDSLLIQGAYMLGSGVDFLQITNDSGLEDVFIRKMSVIDEDFVGFWMLDTAYAEGSEYAFYEYPTLMVESNGTLLMGFMEGFNWSVNSSFLIMESQTNPNYDNIVCSYHCSQDSDSLYFTHYDIDDITYHYYPVKWEAVFYRYGNGWENE